MGRPKAFTPEQELAVCEMYERVERAVPVAEAFGVNAQTIYRVLEKYGIPRTHRHPKEKNDTDSNRKSIDRAKVGELYQSGMSVGEIAKLMDCSASAIYYHLDKLGLYEIGQRKANIDALVPQIMELHKQGLSDYEIASRLGIGRDAINKRLRKAGIHRGKGSNSDRGALVRAEKFRKQAVARFESIADRFELLDYTDAEHALVRCKVCGTEFNWYRDKWEMAEPCPECYAAHIRAESERKQRKQYEREQQREAAREWRLSVPHICKECGEPFYSERSKVSYCCDKCRRRADNRKTAARRQQRGTAHGYGNRMRIERTPATYDRTVTLGAVYKKYGGRCCQCGCMTYRTKGYAPNQATLDHKIALANNGTHTWDNVQLLCSDCNSMKRDIGQMRLPIAV